MDGYMFCAHAEGLVVEELRRAPTAKWWLTAGLTRVVRDTIRPQIQAAMNAWSSVAAVAATEAQSEQEADLVIRVARIDGGQGVLADCYLPGPVPQIMRLDDSELWIIHLGADVDPSAIDLYRVLLHELGHFWGMGHAPRGSANLMAPNYSRSIWTPREWEIAQMQQMYGKPRVDPPPPAPPVPPTIEPGEIWLKDKAGKWVGGWEVGKRVA